ncbi:disease resistance protein L6-like [Cryptomeria japonica]|uniref:disease resistance protein L6-like n=1 Tax=Cryptomeria japonica TaxID=3369 RepID=UPI0027DA0A58|nr:disease resistance protein L6-like [Cryptomeria japonica]
MEYKPQSKKASVQRKKNSIFLICYDWDWIKTLVDKLVKSLNAGGVKVIVIDLFHWEMTDKKSFSSKQVSEGTNIHIPIFSKKNYLWHLEQWLCTCRPNSIIRPLFYDANEDIKYLYDKFLNKLANAKDSTDGIFSSLNAPPQASFLSGWSSLDYRTEWSFMKRVVFDILEMLNNLPLHLPLHAIGLEERTEDLTGKLEMESDELKKEQILRDLSRKDILVKSFEHGKALMKAHLGSIRALVILDDIDHSMQSEALSVDWLAPGSRLLLISRDTKLLAFLHADRIYEMDILEFEQSVELFSWHAFLRTYPDDGYEDRSQKIVKACHGIPFLLEVAGASLYGRREIRCWDESIRHLENTIDQDIHRRLCVCTQVLTYHEIEIFLDIACFFVGKENLETASRFWEAIGHTPKRDLENIIQNSLVMINDKSQFIMHDLLQDMGRAMIADKSPDLGERSRLWTPEDAVQVITKGLGTMSVQGISISRAERSNIAFKAESFAPMTNLQLLWIDGENVDGDFLNLCPGLRWLR